MTAPRLALGPLTYYWPRVRTFDFYRRALDWPVDVVYLGETVCSRRHELRLPDWLGLARDFAEAGKEVVLSTFELIETDADLRVMRSVAENGRFMVEANDMGAVHVLAGKAPFVAGPYLNVYNAATLRLLAECGASRWVAPIELAGAGIAAIAAELPEIETEVFAWGRIPLAVSARCFTARYHNLDKDHCEYRCLADPGGMPLATREGEPFLVLNGVQTQSARVHSLLPWVGEVVRCGARVLRLSPQAERMDEVVAAFAAAAHGARPRGLALAAPATCDGYWWGKPGMASRGEAP